LQEKREILGKFVLDSDNSLRVISMTSNLKVLQGYLLVLNPNYFVAEE